MINVDLYTYIECNYIIVLKFIFKFKENLKDGPGGRLRVSASEQNLSKIGKAPTPMPRSKMNTPNMKKPQQVHGIARGMAVRI
jgi:hypothetical protein